MSNVVLTGFSVELLSLASRLGINVTAVVDPSIPRQLYNDLSFFTSDKSALEHLKLSGVLNGIDHIPTKIHVDLLYVENNIHPVNLLAGTICKSSQYGAGLVMQTNSVLSSNCKLGRLVKLNTSSTVTHDVEIGDYSIIAPGAVICGRVKIGVRTYIGANSTILPDINIGDDVKIGAGSVVTSDVASGAIVKGNPAC